MKNPLSVRGHLQLISKEPLDKAPDFATVGAYSVGGVIFDWEMHIGNHTRQEDGRYLLDFTLQNFDTEFFIASNEGLTEPDWESILKSGIGEINYEVGFLDIDETEIPMEVLEFAVGEWEGPRLKFYDFSTEQIKAFNEREAALARG